MNWLILIKEELGDAWLNNNMFRIGASGIEMSMKFRESFYNIRTRLLTIKVFQQLKGHCRVGASPDIMTYFAKFH